MQYFRTTFENKSKGTIFVNEDGKELLRLEPGQKKFVESKSAVTSYSPFERIVYEKDGTMKLTENPDWKWPGPPDQLMLTILNTDGAGSELFHVAAGEPVICYRGVPRYVAIPYWDAEWRYVEKLEIKFIEHIEKTGDYIKRKNVLEFVKTMRSKKEIASIEKRLIDEATAQAKENLAQQRAASEWRLRSAGLP